MQEMKEIRGQSLGWEDPLEEGMATHSRVLAWRIPWTEHFSRISQGEILKESSPLISMGRAMD